MNYLLRSWSIGTCSTQPRLEDRLRIRNQFWFLSLPPQSYCVCWCTRVHHVRWCFTRFSCNLFSRYFFFFFLIRFQLSPKFEMSKKKENKYFLLLSILFYIFAKCNEKFHEFKRKLSWCLHVVAFYFFSCVEKKWSEAITASIFRTQMNQFWISSDKICISSM